MKECDVHGWKCSEYECPVCVRLWLKEREDELAISIQALKFYSSKQNWAFYCSCCADGTTPLEKDLGKIADEALSLIFEGEPK